ncbi:unnamed protein product [Cladocopium goreaui]|uniref:Ribosomal RNA large subunit methyltransferase F n=1 Tax=Cladocopium goreaui TaxID=2562237 RepID=A0A9P1GN17_9DINO|nr:unnamed protein product [Cladocopium goreaui]
MHPRNKHREYLDYRDLAKKQKGLRRFVYENQWGGASIDYSDPEALEELTRSLLAEFYQIQHWNLPAGYLCPPVPQRVDYLHIMADLLRDTLKPAEGTEGPEDPEGPEGKQETQIPQGLCGLDIGTGASCIYSLLGAREYAWRFIASDIDAVALQHAAQLVAENGLEKQITLRRQEDPKRVLRGVMPKKVSQSVAFAVCNPPFHESLEQAQQAARSKWQRLGKELESKNYQGRELELCCEGGEVGFVQRFAEESAKVCYRSKCVWFSSLLSRHSSWQPVVDKLRQLGAKHRSFELGTGRNVKWVIAWTFLPKSLRRLQLQLQLMLVETEEPPRKKRRS